MTGDNHLSELQTCLVGLSDELPYLEAFIQDMENLDFVKAFE